MWRVPSPLSLSARLSYHRFCLFTTSSAQTLPCNRLSALHSSSHPPRILFRFFAPCSSFSSTHSPSRSSRRSKLSDRKRPTTSQTSISQALSTFQAWCDAHHIFAPKITFLPCSPSGEPLQFLSFPNRSTAEIQQLLIERNLPATGTREELLQRLPRNMRGVREMSHEELRAELQLRGADVRGRPMELANRLKSIYIEEDLQRQLAGEPVHYCLYARVALEREGIYAAIPTRLIMCKGTVLQNSVGLALKLPWPVWTKPKTPFRRQLYLNYQFEELFCLALFFISQQRQPASMWAPWISVISSLPLPVNVFVMGEEEIEQLKGSHVHDDIVFIRELARDWFEMYVNEPHVITQIGAVSQEDFMVACALMLSRAQLVPPVPSLKGAQFGVVPFADFLSQGRESNEVVEEAQVLSPTGRLRSQWPVANMVLKEAEDSLELRRDMRAAFNMPPEKKEEQEECVFLEASRDVALGKCLYLAASGNQDNAELLLTHGLVSEEDATTIKFRTLANDTWTAHNVDKLGETRYQSIILEVFRIASHFTDLQHPDLKALPDILWTLPSLPRGLHLLQRSIFPFMCMQTKDFDVNIARGQLRALFETKLASYSNGNLTETGAMLIEWEQNLIRRYLSLLDTLEFDPVVYAENILPESEEESSELIDGEETDVGDLDEDIDEEEFENFKKLFDKTQS